jgi:large subunit ribosomal protein L6
MSRVGLRPVPLVAGVQISVGDGRVKVAGPKAMLEEPLAPHTRVEVRERDVVVSREDDTKPAKAAHGLMRSQLANMIRGVTQGFERKLEIVGVGYRAEVSGRVVKLLVGYSHPVEVPVPEGIEVRTESPTRLSVAGPDKQRVGQFAAELRRVRPPEPYKGKGIRYVDERIRRKVGKSGA